MTGNWRTGSLANLTFAIIGLGLIGGSYAKALRKLQVKHIWGMDISRGIAKACLDAHMIDKALMAGSPELAQADVVICCVYPGAVLDFVRCSGRYLRPGTLVTDATGIKGKLPEEVQQLLPDGCEFVAGHPMAGRQGSGLGMADAAIFEGSNYIIVPSAHNTESALLWLEKFAQALGCKRTVRLSAEEHDRIIAYTSDLPHILAVSLVNSASFTEHTPYFIAGSFKDATRVADINPELWSDLFLANRENVLAEIKKYEEQLQAWQIALEQNDRQALSQMMRDAGLKRRELY